MKNFTPSESRDVFDHLLAHLNEIGSHVNQLVVLLDFDNSLRRHFRQIIFHLTTLRTILRAMSR